MKKTTIKLSIIILLLVQLLNYSCNSNKKNASNWSHTELIEYLHSKGLKFEAKSGGMTGGFYGISMEYVFENGTDMFVIAVDSEQKAKDMASSIDDNLGFSYGRFCISCDRNGTEELKKIKEALN